METAVYNIEKFPNWGTRRPVSRVRAADWVSLGSEYDIRHVVRLWELVMRQRLHDLPDDDSVIWQIADALNCRTSDAVVVRDGLVLVDRRHLGEFRESMDWLWNHLVDEHGDERYYWSRTTGDWLRIPSEHRPITSLEDARRAIEILDVLMDTVVDNVIRVRGDA
jgi:hypothetical protein